MAASTVARIGAGSVLLFEDPDTANKFLPLTEALSIGAIGEQGEFVETTPIAASTRTYIPGLKTPPDKEITGNDIPGDANQEKFLALAKAMATINMKVELANGRIAIFTLVMSGWQINEPAGDGALVWTAYGKQSGDVRWAVASSKTDVQKAA